MKKGTLTNVTTDEAGVVVQTLGGRTLLYRDVPLLDASQLPDVTKEFSANKCDSILFDKGAIFDQPAYDLAYTAAKMINNQYPDKLKVVIFNAPVFPMPEAVQDPKPF